MIMPPMVTGDYQLEASVNLPYILVSNLNTRLNQYYSLTNRLEESLMRFTIFATSCPETEEIIAKIEEVYDSCTLELANRTFNGMIWAGSDITELEPGIWMGIVEYEVFTMKESVHT